VGLAIGQRPEPGAENIYAVDFFLVREAAQTGAPLRGNDARGMIRKSRKDGDVVSGLGPMLGQFGGTGRGRAHLGREVLGDVENFHAKVEGNAKGAKCGEPIGRERASRLLK
jgi:hypothetical protein